MPSQSEMRATLARYLDCVRAQDVDGVLALFSDDISVQDPVGGSQETDVRGRKDVDVFFRKGFARSHPQPRLVGSIVTTLGDEAAVPFTLELDLAGRRCEVDVIDVVRFDAKGRINRLRAFWNPNEIRDRT